jgi:hypothetical protein
MITQKLWKKIRNKRSISKIVSLPAERTPLRVHYPWRVSTRMFCSLPMIVDRYGVVVAQLMSGGMETAEQIVQAANAAAEREGRTEI